MVVDSLINFTTFVFGRLHIRVNLPRAVCTKNIMYWILIENSFFYCELFGVFLKQLFALIAHTRQRTSIRKGEFVFLLMDTHCGETNCCGCNQELNPQQIVFQCIHCSIPFVLCSECEVLSVIFHPVQHVFATGRLDVLLRNFENIHNVKGKFDFEF